MGGRAGGRVGGLKGRAHLKGGGAVGGDDLARVGHLAAAAE
jgi:hypothetical protein